MNGPQSKSEKPKDQEIGAAEWLFQDGPPASSTRPAGPAIGTGSSEGFDLVDMPAPIAPALPGSPLASKGPAEFTRPSDAPPRTRMVAPAAPAVEQVWSRGSEWAPTLVILGSWILAILALVYFLGEAELYGTAGLLLLIGGLVAVVLCYPIVITLERPVRVTPEQAARDYFGALSHHFPHYRRMWLLLAPGAVSRPSTHRMKVSSRTGSTGSESSMTAVSAGFLRWSSRSTSSSPRRRREDGDRGQIPVAGLRSRPPRRGADIQFASEAELCPRSRQDVVSQRRHTRRTH